MKLTSVTGTLKRYGGAGVYINDFQQYQGQNLPGTKWALWGNVGPLHRVQAELLNLHEEVVKRLRKVCENADLTEVAKTRQSTVIFNEFRDVVDALLPSVGESATNLHTFASQHLLPVQPLTATDAVGAALDAECRAYAFGLNAKNRSELAGEMMAGREPRITAAVLRGPARVSGFTGVQLSHMGAAGVAVSYPDAVLTLGKLAGAMRDVVFMTQTLGNDVINAGVGLEGRSKEVGAWSKPSEGYNALLEWLAPIPLELPTNRPVPDEVAKHQAGDSE